MFSNMVRYIGFVTLNTIFKGNCVISFGRVVVIIDEFRKVEGGNCKKVI